MDAWFNNFDVGGLMNAGSRWFLDAALQHFFAFVMVLMRCSGLMSTAPIFSQAVVPFRARVALIIGLSLVLTPLVHDGASQRLSHFDANKDGRITLSEAPETMRSRLRQIAIASGVDVAEGIPITALRHPKFETEHPSELIKAVAGEVGIGMLLGLGIMIVLGGLQFAGQLIDEQIGLNAAAVLNPHMGGPTLSSQTFMLLGSVAFLLMEPLGGHLVLVGSLVETFDSLPIGQIADFSNVPQLMTELVHKSLLIGLQVCGPLLAAMSLVTMCLGYLGHAVPQFNILVLGAPIRSLVGTLLLTLSMSDTARVAIDAVPDVLHELQFAMSEVADLGAGSNAP